MDEQTAAALARRLAAYSATAGAALAVAPGVGAQAVYRDIEPDVTAAAYALDIDGDGNVDLKWCNFSCEPRASATFALIAVEARGIAPVGIQGDQCCNNAFFASRLSGGGFVGPGAGDSFREEAILASALTGPYPCYGEFCGEQGYAGFRFLAGDGKLHYGWIRLHVRNTNTLYVTAYDYAYEAAPSTPLRAGSGSVILTGYTSDQIFPPEGGHFRYAFTLRNTTAEPLTLDLWMDAELLDLEDPISVVETHTRLFGSSVVPPNGAVTGAVRVRVPAVTPAGTYRVRFKAGDFGTGQFRTFHRYTMQKEEGATAAATAGDEAALFAVASVEGDVFTVPEAPGAEAPAIEGTHALSAPSPNPSDGRVALTLSVAEAQAVRVEVLDALGRSVAVLHDGAMGAGAEHRLAFEGSELPVGVYVVRAVGERFADVRVLSLAR